MKINKNVLIEFINSQYGLHLQEGLALYDCSNLRQLKMIEGDTIEMSPLKRLVISFGTGKYVYTFNLYNFIPGNTSNGKKFMSACNAEWIKAVSEYYTEEDKEYVEYIIESQIRSKKAHITLNDQLAADEIKEINEEARKKIAKIEEERAKEREAEQKEISTLVEALDVVAPSEEESPAETEENKNERCEISPRDPNYRGSKRK